jgi:hypothetical protein
MERTENYNKCSNSFVLISKYDIKVTLFLFFIFRHLKNSWDRKEKEDILLHHHVFMIHLNEDTLQIALGETHLTATEDFLLTEENTHPREDILLRGKKDILQKTKEIHLME